MDLGKHSLLIYPTLTVGKQERCASEWNRASSSLISAIMMRDSSLIGIYGVARV